MVVVVVVVVAPRASKILSTLEPTSTLDLPIGLFWSEELTKSDLDATLPSRLSYDFRLSYAIKYMGA